MVHTEFLAEAASTSPVLPLDLSLPYGFRADAKDPVLLDTLNALTRWHMHRCAPFADMVQRLFPAWGQAASRTEVPYLPVRLFKSL